MQNLTQPQLTMATGSFWYKMNHPSCQITSVPRHQHVRPGFVFSRVAVILSPVMLSTPHNIDTPVTISFIRRQ